MRASIVICNYNYGRFIDSAIRSAVEQDHADTEVIVVDDGSTDGSHEVITRWGDEIHVVRKENGGQLSAYNAGFSQVTGDFVIFLDADDTLDPVTCSRVVERFVGGVVKVHFRLRLVDESGTSLGSIIPTHVSEGRVGDRLQSKGELYDSSPGSGNAYLVAALRRLMPLPADDRDRHGADFFVAYGVPLLGSVAIAGPEPLGTYRVHRVEGTDDLVFGNANEGVHEPERTHARYERMRAWLLQRLGESFVLPPLVPSFSLEKQGYAIAIFRARTYGEGLGKATPLLVRSVLPSIRRRRESWVRRATLAGWALGVLVLPRRVGLPLARFVCNPASR